MKIRIIAVFVTASFFLASCSLFKSKPNTLVGNWRIDSLHITKDSNAIGYLLLAMAKQEDSTKADIAFTKDSVLFFSNEANEKIAYHLNAANELILQDASNEHFRFQKLNDSLITLSSKDSTTLFLRKL